MIKRYDFQVCEEYAGNCNAVVESDDGDYCLYSDVEALEKERDELIEQNKAIAALELDAQKRKCELRAERDKLRAENVDLHETISHALHVQKQLNEESANLRRELIGTNRENEKLIARLKRFEEGMPPAEHITELFSYYDGCEQMAILHHFAPSEEKRARLIPVNRWIRKFGVEVPCVEIGEKQQEGEKGGKNE